jgi:sugar lactone lactonase YvrE
MPTENETQWSFGDELYESRNWEPDRSKLGSQWRSIASQRLRKYRDRYISISADPDDKYSA